MDVLLAEIARKRKAIESHPSPSPPSGGAGAGAAAVADADDGSANVAKRPRFVRKADLERAREAAYLEQQRARDEERMRKKNAQERKTAHKDQEAENGAPNDAAKTEIELPAAEEVIKRLRQKGEPIRLFGESDVERYLRLRQLEIEEEKTEGQSNDFMTKVANLDHNLDLEALKRQAGEDDSASKSKLINDSYGNVVVGTVPANETEPIDAKLYKKDPNHCYALIYVYLKRLLREWEEELNQRPDAVKRSVQGKMATAVQLQSLEYMAPFFRKLRTKTMEETVIEKLADVCGFMQQREYVRANDSYLRLSIGNAAWPIGVTMVGIHERSAREKISSDQDNQIAHVLNDEVQRKWIHSLKRLMTFCQHRYPPDDLAKAIG